MTARVRRERERRADPAELAPPPGWAARRSSRSSPVRRRPACGRRRARRRSRRRRAERVGAGDGAAPAPESVSCSPGSGARRRAAAARLVGAAHGPPAPPARRVAVDVERSAARSADDPGGCAQALGDRRPCRASGRPVGCTPTRRRRAAGSRPASCTARRSMRRAGGAAPGRAGARGLDLGTWGSASSSRRGRAPRDLGAALARPARFVGRASSSAAETRARATAGGWPRRAASAWRSATTTRPPSCARTTRMRPSPTGPPRRLGLGFVPPRAIALRFARDDDGGGARRVRPSPRRTTSRATAAMGHGATEHRVRPRGARDGMSRHRRRRWKRGRLEDGPGADGSVLVAAALAACTPGGGRAPQPPRPRPRRWWRAVRRRGRRDDGRPRTDDARRRGRSERPVWDASAKACSWPTTSNRPLRWRATAEALADAARAGGGPASASPWCCRTGDRGSPGSATGRRATSSSWSRGRLARRPGLIRSAAASARPCAGGACSSRSSPVSGGSASARWPS